MILSTQILNLRKQRKLSQSQLAKELNISASTLGMYEQGRRMPSLDILIKLSAYFHVSLDYLITGSEFPNSTLQAKMRSPETCPCNSCYWKEYLKR